jgi:hypothetical protein
MITGKRQSTGPAPHQPPRAGRHHITHDTLPQQRATFLVKNLADQIQRRGVK